MPFRVRVKLARRRNEDEEATEKVSRKEEREEGMNREEEGCDRMKSAGGEDRDMGRTEAWAGREGGREGGNGLLASI